MPVTFPAHQGLIVPLKLRWPTAIDGTALCIGAAAPDLAYPLGSWLNAQSHALLGLIVWALPVTLGLTTLVRWRAADGIFANMADLGPLRLRSYRVLGRRRPRFLATLSSAVVGAGSHIVFDAFTHTGRWGSDLLGLDGVVGTVPLRGEMTEARVLQYVGHIGGTLSFVVALLLIASSGKLERWYGAEEVAAARRRPGSRGGPALFWGSVVGVGVVAATVIVTRTVGGSTLFLPIVAAVVSIVGVGAAVGSPQPRATIEPST